MGRSHMGLPVLTHVNARRRAAPRLGGMEASLYEQIGGAAGISRLVATGIMG